MNLKGILMIPLHIFFYIKLMIEVAYATYRRSRRRTPINDLTGKTAIVTGANRGIGYYTALGLAERNARVVLGCRDVRKGNEAAEQIVAQTGNTQVVCYTLDVSKLSSVCDFVKTFLRNEERLHILINNAAISATVPVRWVEGLNSTLAANHYGPFLLTNLLLDILKDSAPSRIVCLSSGSHGILGLDDIWARDAELPANLFERAHFYGSTKTANILFARRLARILEGTGVTSNSVDPGLVSTDICKGMPFPITCLLDAYLACFGQSPEEGAQPSLYCATSDELSETTGVYFEGFEVGVIKSEAKSDVNAEKLWKLSTEVTGLRELKLLHKLYLNTHGIMFLNNNNNVTAKINVK